MKSKGYTSLDIIIVILILAVSAVIILPRVSMALEDNKGGLYENQIRLYLNQAVLYGENNKDEFDDDNTMVLTIDDLIDKGYVLSMDDNIYDVRDNTTELNKLKIKLTYSEEQDKVTAELM